MNATLASANDDQDSIAFTGKGTPPKELKSDADVKAFVAGDPKAIGYVD